ncbi:MAG: alkaline phosphatase PhoX [Gemmatimonadales bacterium]
MDRRNFIRYSTRFTGAVAGFSALQQLACNDDRAPRLNAASVEGSYGPLVEAGPELALPVGFQYRVIGVEGTRMSDGNITPSLHDGMCALPLPNGNIRLIRNHEVTNKPADGSAFGNQATAYDHRAGGGTTSLEIDAKTREVVREFASLNGTYRNCAGGPTPWGSWLSCEETFAHPDNGFTQVHGYVFEVPALLEEARPAQPLRAMGRFVHEAVAVDPATGIVYETEDSGRAGFYRFLPNRPYSNGDGGDLTAGGRLQMLAVRDRPRHDLSVGQTVGVAIPVTWVDIKDPDPTDTDNSSAVFEQGWEAGGARFVRLEGCWYGNGNIYVASTSGGDRSLGQIWQYRATGVDSGELTLVFESPSKDVLNMPDNITVSPRGGIVLCEDGSNDPQKLRGLTPDGRIFDLVANIANPREVAGATFSPDGKTLFFNAQGTPGKIPGMTFAVWGPWERGAL